MFLVDARGSKRALDFYLVTSASRKRRSLGEDALELISRVTRARLVGKED